MYFNLKILVLFQTSARVQGMSCVYAYFDLILYLYSQGRVDGLLV